MRGQPIVRKAKTALCVAIAALLATTLTACGSSSDSGSTSTSNPDTKVTSDTGSTSNPGSSSNSGSGSGVYTIGANLPLTVPGDTVQIWVSAIGMAVDYVNQQHLIDGTLKTSFVDSKAQPATGVTTMQQLVNVDHAIGVLTGMSGVVKATAPIANRTTTPMINATAMSPELANLGPYVFSNIPVATYQLPVAVPYLAKTKGLKRWSILYSSDVLGQGMLAQLKELVPANGAEIVGTHSVAPDATDFQSQVSLIKAEKPDIVFFAYTQYSAYLNNAAAAGLTAVNATYDGVFNPDILKNSNAEGAYTTAYFQDLTLKNPETTAFLTAYKAKYGADATPQGLSVNLFNGVLIYAKAIAQLQKDGKQVTTSNVRDAMSTMHFSLAGVNDLSFNSEGGINGPMIQMMQVKNHALVPITDPVASGS